MQNIRPPFPHLALHLRRAVFRPISQPHYYPSLNPPYHDTAYWVYNDKISDIVYRFFSEYHINPNRFPLWAQAMDMELYHTNVFINPLTMDIDIQADVVRPGFPPFDHPHPNLYYRCIYPLPVGCYDLFSAEFLTRYTAKNKS